MLVSALVMVPLAGFVVVVYFLSRLTVTRARPVRPAAATPDLRDESPAVVNLLVNRMTDAPQVASATLLAAITGSGDWSGTRYWMRGVSG